MRMSMPVYAVKPADENYKRKADAYRACVAAGIAIPEELEKFFGGEEPDAKGIVVQLDRGLGRDSLDPSVTRYKAEMQDGFEVDITKLPDGTRFVRFVCNW